MLNKVNIVNITGLQTGLCKNVKKKYENLRLIINIKIDIFFVF